MQLGVNVGAAAAQVKVRVVACGIGQQQLIVQLLAGGQHVDKGLLVAAAEVHRTVEHHAPDLVGKQRGVPTAQPSAIRVADVVQLGLAQQAAQQVHVAGRGIGADIRRQRISSTSLGGFAVVISRVVQVGVGQRQRGRIDKALELVGAAVQTGTGAGAARRKPHHVVAGQQAQLQGALRAFWVTLVKGCKQVERLPQPIAARPTGVEQHRATALGRVGGGYAHHADPHITALGLGPIHRRAHRAALQPVAQLIPGCFF